VRECVCISRVCESVCVYLKRECVSHSTLTKEREHFHRKRTHSIGREHILQEENTFYRDRQIASHSTLTKEKSGCSHDMI